ncbi:MAG: DUF177 domain-containing protein [Deltaproteobacteria bacterium]|nr:DUF177 domain-containing protein [Deltaproteobacteria bacterium]
MESVRNNLVFSLEAWPEAGHECDFALSPPHLTDILNERESQVEIPKILTSMRGHVKLGLVGRGLKIKGFFAVKVELLCDRCLTPFVSRINDEFDDRVNLTEPSQTDDRGQGNGHNQDDDAAVPIRADNSFDLAPLMAEFFWLAWPYKSLCRPDCAGLCPKCGANLNDGPCFCQNEQPTKH